MTLNRAVVIATVALDLAAAVAPVVADMDFSSVAGIAAGLIPLNAAVLKWLDGWQKHEQRLATRSNLRREIPYDEWGPTS